MKLTPSTRRKGAPPEKAVREGRLDAGSDSHTPEPAMSLAEKLAVLHKQRTTVAGIKEGNLCLRGRYVTATHGKDTKIIELFGV